MSYANPYEKYRENSVKTASQGELTLMLFEGCWKFLKKAKTAIIEKNVSEAHNNLIKAQKIVLELMNSLNFNYEISHDLYSVYDYIYRELIKINMKKDAERLEPIIEIIYGYYETWKEVIKKDRISKHAGVSDGGYV
ncbi:MAG: flagellar export chaperone FliS [Clostridia bacterium]|nr:flagellar export chaperone FliS [Clostridia bacterium]